MHFVKKTKQKKQNLTFWLKYHNGLFLRVHQKVGSSNGLALNRQQTITCDSTMIWFRQLRFQLIVNQHWLKVSSNNRLASLCLNQWWPSSNMPYSITRYPCVYVFICWQDLVAINMLTLMLKLFRYSHHTIISWGLVTPFGDIDLGQHWLRWWLDAWRHQAITWNNVDLSSVRSCGIHLRAIS